MGNRDEKMFIKKCSGFEGTKNKEMILQVIRTVLSWDDLNIPAPLPYPTSSDRTLLPYHTRSLSRTAQFL
jgi:hypothetical protein